MFEYMSWWVSALLLTLLAMGFFLSTRRTLSGSGNWTRIVLRDSREDIIQAEGAFRENPAMLKDALMKATIEEFGYKAVVSFLAERKGEALPHAVERRIKTTDHTHWTVHMVFLVMLVVGGFVAAKMTGTFAFRADLGEMHTVLFGGGMGYWITLIIGGGMLGFGSQLGGGCSFGHGLGGCPRFVPSSLIATATFFMTAIIVSVGIHFVITGALQ
ncbi:hypothetical protein MNBD_GAMMA07-561 [hydrothermal vent metagenome]|uniref:Uncharacterized protein n=1 Tax=hydrothermal vent metagenome TaxID=652676 RepID=A0A3B0XKE5_9ZZZZ